MASRSPTSVRTSSSRRMTTREAPLVVQEPLGAQSKRRPVVVAQRLRQLDVDDAHLPRPAAPAA